MVRSWCTAIRRTCAARASRRAATGTTQDADHPWNLISLPCAKRESAWRSVPAGDGWFNFAPDRVHWASCAGRNFTHRQAGQGGSALQFEQEIQLHHGRRRHPGGHAVGSWRISAHSGSTSVETLAHGPDPAGLARAARLPTAHFDRAPGDATCGCPRRGVRRDNAGRIRAARAGVRAPSRTANARPSSAGATRLPARLASTSGGDTGQLWPPGAWAAARSAASTASSGWRAPRVTTSAPAPTAPQEHHVAGVLRGVDARATRIPSHGDNLAAVLVVPTCSPSACTRRTRNAHPALSGNTVSSK